MAHRRNQGRTPALTIAVPIARAMVCTEIAGWSRIGSAPRRIPCQAMARMHALSRDVPNTAKSLSTTRNSASSARDFMRGSSSCRLAEEQDESEEADRRPHGAVERHLWQAQTGHDRLHNADRDGKPDEPNGEQRQSDPFASAGPWAQDVE